MSTEFDKDFCNRVPETSRCNARKNVGECAATKLGRVCISRHMRSQMLMQASENNPIIIHKMVQINTTA
jgi:hypothetical protein